MSYPRYSSAILAANDYMKEADYDPLVARYYGSTATGIVTGPHSFLIRYTGGVYEALNSVGVLTYGGSGNTGGADGTDIKDVIQTLLDNLDFSLGVGTQIYFKSGLYTFPSGFSVAKHVGETWNTAIDFIGETGLYGTVLKKGFDGDLITLGDGVDRIGYLGLKNLYVDGNERTGYALKMDTVSSVNMDNVQIEDNADTAIYTDAIWGGSQIWRNLSVQDCGDVGKPAVNLQGASNGVVIDGGSISVNRDVGLSISANSGAMHISGLVSENVPSVGYAMIEDYGMGDVFVNNTLNVGFTTTPVLKLSGIRTVCAGNVITASSNAGTGIYATGGFSGIISNNYIFDCLIGIYTDNAFPTITNNQLANNTVGIKLGAVAANLTGNTYLLTKQQSIYCDTTSYTTITGEHIINSGFSSGANSYSGIYLHDSNMMNIANCVVFDYATPKTTKYGVEENGSSNQNLISNLNGDATGLGGVYRLGNKTRIVNSWVASDTFVDDNFVDRGTQTDCVNGSTISYALPQKATNVRLTMLGDTVTATNKLINFSLYGHAWGAGTGTLTLGMYDSDGAAIAVGNKRDIDWFVEYKQ
jgi:hypothetical protein